MIRQYLAPRAHPKAQARRPRLWLSRVLELRKPSGGERAIARMPPNSADRQDKDPRPCQLLFAKLGSSLSPNLAGLGRGSLRQLVIRVLSKVFIVAALKAAHSGSGYDQWQRLGLRLRHPRFQRLQVAKVQCYLGDIGRGCQIRSSCRPPNASAASCGAVRCHDRRGRRDLKRLLVLEVRVELVVQHHLDGVRAHVLLELLVQEVLRDSAPLRAALLPLAGALAGALASAGALDAGALRAPAAALRGGSGALGVALAVAAGGDGPAARSTLRRLRRLPLALAAGPSDGSNDALAAGDTAVAALAAPLAGAAPGVGVAALPGRRLPLAVALGRGAPALSLARDAAGETTVTHG
mmetsp:Transcript_64210/g.168045  ORF Transcript_64210/g.168045 Transcript_64210/m.168045 type:complete len:352 (-) Transcript_64210:55-1110(-)